MGKQKVTHCTHQCCRGAHFCNMSMHGNAVESLLCMDYQGSKENQSAPFNILSLIQGAKLIGMCKICKKVKINWEMREM